MMIDIEFKDIFKIIVDKIGFGFVCLTAYQFVMGHLMRKFNFLGSFERIKIAYMLVRFAIEYVLDDRQLLFICVDIINSGGCMCVSCRFVEVIF